MVSEAQKAASKRYVKACVTTRVIKFYPKDKELLEWLDAHTSKAQYIRDLIAQDMAKHKDADTTA